MLSLLVLFLVSGSLSVSVSVTVSRHPFLAVSGPSAGKSLPLKPHFRLFNSHVLVFGVFSVG